MDSIHKCLIVASILGAFIADASSQGVLGNSYVPPDESYERTNWKKSVIQYPHLREADVMYKKRIWQVIDLTQKFNHPFYYPQDEIKDRKNLLNTILYGLREGIITAYDPSTELDDEFEYPIDSPEKLEQLLKKPEAVPDYNEFDEIIGYDTTYVDLDFELVTRYSIKEEWIWDKQRSERYVRILGIAPMIPDIKDGVDRGFKPLFWLYYPDCREFFASDKAMVYNPFNDAQRRTFEDLFQKRYFSSYIVKEDNAFDRTIQAYAKGQSAIAESERIQQELFNLEHDLWHY